MIDEVVELLRREATAAEAVEARLRALELVVAAGSHRFVALATDELETSSERLSALELARTMAVSALGLDPAATAPELVDAVASPEDAERLEGAIDQLRGAASRLADARERARVAVTAAAGSSRARLDAARALQAV